MLLKLTTIVVAFLVWVPVAQAWTWPVQGPVLAPFSFDPAHPYAAGQHRGLDIGAARAGDPVVAPAGGTVSFAGSVPTSGKCLTIETPDGYSVTLTHLGSLALARGAAVVEGAVVGTVGPSGTAEETSPYVHLGIRTTADANGYLDPLGLLPALAPLPSGSTDGSSASAGAGDGSSSAPAPAPTPAPVSEPVAVPAAPAAVSDGAGVVVRGRPAAPHPAQTTRTRVTRRAHRVRGVRRPGSKPKPIARPIAEPRTLRRPFEEPSRGRPATPAPSAPILAPLALGAGPGLVAAVVALATALVRVRRRRRPDASVIPFPDELELRRAA